MYKLPESGQISFRISENDKEVLQSLADKLQIDNQETFKNARDIVFAIIEELQTLSAIREEQENKIATLENRATSLLAELQKIDAEKEDKEALQNEFQPLFDEARELIGYDEAVENSTILKDLIVMINTPQKPAPPVEVEVIKEVEKPLSADEILLKLSSKQIEVLEYISEWRHRKGLDKTKQTNAEIIKAMTFHRGALLNYSDEYRTGITPKNLR